MEPNDSCFYLQTYTDPETGEVKDFTDMIKHVRWWVEDENGNPTNGNGVVKIEYDKDFFGENPDSLFNR